MRPSLVCVSGGNIIQEECSEYMRNKLDLLPGQVFTSSPGSLPCKFVIHAVGPLWKDGTKGEMNELYEATSSSLDEAEKLAAKSIAIPVISSGIFGFPLEEATKTICEAIVDYFKMNPSSSIAEIHLMDNREKAASLFQESIRKHASDASRHYHTSRSTTPAGGNIVVINSWLARHRCDCICVYVCVCVCVCVYLCLHIVMCHLIHLVS